MIAQDRKTITNDKLNDQTTPNMIHSLWPYHSIQAHIPPALAAIHNFICMYDPEELADFTESEDLEPGFVLEGLAEGIAGRAERRQVKERWDDIANDMWTQYQAEFQWRGM